MASFISREEMPGRGAGQQTEPQCGGQSLPTSWAHLLPTGSPESLGSSPSSLWGNGHMDTLKWSLAPSLHFKEARL